MSFFKRKSFFFLLDLFRFPFSRLESDYQTSVRLSFPNFTDYIHYLDKDGRAFNDFKVFDEGNKFSSTFFQYHEYHFDQLKELMYYNVISHIEVSRAFNDFKVFIVYN